MDYRALLLQYIRFVRECEGVDFIDSRRSEADVEFTNEEWQELELLSAEAVKESAETAAAEAFAERAWTMVRNLTLRQRRA